MSQLSELAVRFRKMKNAKHATGLRGMLKGAVGSMGSKTLQSRNPVAGMNKEMEVINSPLFKAFLQKQVVRTPITDYLHKAVK